MRADSPVLIRSSPAHSSCSSWLCRCLRVVSHGDKHRYFAFHPSLPYLKSWCWGAATQALLLPRPATWQMLGIFKMTPAPHKSSYPVFIAHCHCSDLCHSNICQLLSHLPWTSFNWAWRMQALLIFPHEAILPFPGPLIIFVTLPWDSISSSLLLWKYSKERGSLRGEEGEDFFPHSHSAVSHATPPKSTLNTFACSKIPLFLAGHWPFPSLGHCSC